MKRAYLRMLALMTGLLSSHLSGCVGAEPDGTERADEGDLGVITLAIATVPSAVQCLQVVVYSAPSGVPESTPLATQNFTTMAGGAWSGSVGLGQFVRGSVQIDARTFNTTCASIGGAMASWVADPVVADIAPGVKTSVGLNFRENFSLAVTGNFAPSIVELVVGAYATGMRLADGSMRIVGNMAPPSPQLTGVVETALSNLHGCARKSDGTVWCWGSNSSGQLGNGTTVSSAAAVQVIGISGAVAIAVGSSTSCASTASQIYCWGSNANGTVGDGTTTNRSTPVAVSGGIGPATRLAVSMTHTCATGAWDGAVRCWGSNGEGQLGNGSTVNSLVPVLAIGVQAATSVAVAFNHTCASDAAGRAYCWGANFHGHLGVGDTVRRTAPTQIPSLTRVAEVSGLAGGSCARTTDRKVYCWGYNGRGDVGDGTGMNQFSPVLILQSATQLRSGMEGSSCALHSDNSVSCWGQNNAGQLGDGTSVARYIPVKMNL